MPARVGVWRSYPLDLSVTPCVRSWTGGETDLTDVTAGDCERAGQDRGGGVKGEQYEADPRREQCAWMLPADRGCGGAG